MKTSKRADRRFDRKFVGKFHSLFSLEWHTCNEITTNEEQKCVRNFHAVGKRKISYRERGVGRCGGDGACRREIFWWGGRGDIFWSEGREGSYENVSLSLPFFKSETL